ncbi:TetR family transcriptional regulator [Cellulomonas sp. CW35]|uniref:TetR family transcriptional regulator n=1 Tax=Cellulomonas sp. CW35 TaxID=3458249 RepID=UPI00228327DC
MHTAPVPGGRPASELTAWARIRDAAIECFAEQGFDAPFRVIAERAGVSPGLITHHFRSKAELREQCDTEVLRRYEALKTSSLGDPSAFLLANLAEPGPAAVLVVYMLRAVHAGGAPARRFLDHLVDKAREVMRAGVESGLLRPSRDEEARLRHLVHQTMGALVVQFLTLPDATPHALVEAMAARQREQVLPTLELFTEGLLTSRRMLDDYLLYVGDPPTGRPQPQPQHESA